MIAQMGDLPPVTERLPTHPKVVTPLEEVGEYGGRFRLAFQGPADGAWLVPMTNGYEFLVRWKPDNINFSLEELEPNVAEDVKIEDNGATYIFTLREGHRWSDGQPYTADDIMFWYNDYLMNEELTSAVSSWLQADDKPVVVEKLDDHTVKFSFSSPNGLFLINLATPGGRIVAGFPAHYMKQFHKKYNPDAVKEAEEQGLESWTDLFLQQQNAQVNPDLPVLYAWVQETGATETTQQVVAHRNPYYFKVDTEGNQLPYMDEVVYRVIQDKEVMTLSALNGEIDFLSPAVPALRDKPLFYDGQEKGGFHLIDAIPAIMNTLLIAINLTHKDKNKRKVFANKDFRIGLSHAINRQEIIDAVFVSQGEPWQGAPRPESELYYNETLAKQYTEYDVDKANEYLDKVLPDKDDDGVRLGPDGKPFFFTVEGAIDTNIAWPDMLEMVRLYWDKVGIKCQIKTIERSLYYERVETNQHDASLWAGGGGIDVVLGPGWYFPSSVLASIYATPWAAWFGNPDGEDAEEPPEDVQKQMTLYRQIAATVDPDEQASLMNQVLDIAVEQFYGIGISLPASGFTSVTNRMHNIPNPMLDAWLYPTPAPTNPEQYFIRE